MKAPFAPFALAAAVVLHTALAWPAIGRTGYTADEEITAIVVNGISATGLPLLPSGVFYNRGLPYLYAAWGAGNVFGHTLTSYRAVSLIAGCAGLIVLFAMTRQVAGVHAATVVALLLAAFPPYLAASVFARQYAMLAAFSLASVLAFLRFVERGAAPRWPFLLAVAIANALHPLGLALAMVPALFTPSARRHDVPRLTIQTLIAISLAHQLYVVHWLSLAATDTTVLAETALYALPTLPALPATYITSVARVTDWLVTGLLFGMLGWLLGRRRSLADRLFAAVCASLATVCQLGVLLTVTAVTVLTSPSRIAFRTLTALACSAGAVAWWAALTAGRTDAMFTPSLIPSTWHAAISYPVSALEYTLDAFPGVVMAAGLGVAINAVSAPQVRMYVWGSTALAVLILTAYSAVGIPPIERYLLLPWLVLLIPAGCSVVALERPPFVGASLAYRCATGGLTLAFGVSLIAGHLEYSRRADRNDGKTPPTSLRELVAPRTNASLSPDHLRALVSTTDVVICTEELACEYLIGRVDYLLATVPIDRAHYAVHRDGELRGFYADRPVVATAQELTGRLSASDVTRCTAVVIANTGKVDFAAYRSLVSSLAASLEAQTLTATDELQIIRFCGAGKGAQVRS